MAANQTNMQNMVLLATNKAQKPPAGATKRKTMSSYAIPKNVKHFKLNCPSPFMCPITQKPGAEVQMEVVVPPEVLPEVKLEVSILPNISSHLMPSGGNTLVQFPVPPVGVSLQHVQGNWEKVGASPKVVHVLRVGFHIPFITCPPVTLEPRFFQPPHCPVQREMLRLEIESLKTKQAIDKVPPGSPGFYSRMFLVPKPGNKWRQTSDRFVKSKHFHKVSKVYHGDTRTNQIGNTSQRLGCIPRFVGRIPTCPDSSELSEISEICLPGTGVGVQSSAIWALPSPMVVHTHEHWR